MLSCKAINPPTPSPRSARAGLMFATSGWRTCSCSRKKRPGVKGLLFPLGRSFGRIGVRNFPSSSSLSLLSYYHHYRRYPVDAATSLNPSPIPSHALPKGIPGAGLNATHKIQYDTAKAAKILGLVKYRTKEELAKDTLEDFEKRGW